jgi:hypothetical protein
MKRPDRGNPIPISSPVCSLLSPLNVFLSARTYTCNMGALWLEEAPEPRPQVHGWNPAAIVASRGTRGRPEDSQGPSDARPGHCTKCIVQNAMNPIFAGERPCRMARSEVL